MKKLLAIAFVTISLSSVSWGQRDGIHVDQFAGVDIAAKATAAQNACFDGTHPCVIIFDASLANFPAGSLPSVCSNCEWIRYDTAAQLKVSNLTVTGTCTGCSGAAGTTINPTNGKLPVRTNGTTFGDAAASDIVNAFTGCSGTQYLGADGACHSIFSAQYITNGNLLGLGDSIVSKNSNGGTYGFTGLMALRDFKGWYLNRGLANDMAADMALKAYDSASSSYVAVPNAGNVDPPTVSIMIGTNDATSKGVGSYQTGVYQRADLAAMAFIGIPRKDTIYMQDAAVTKAGGFSADNSVLTGLGEKSTTGAATLTWSCTGNGNPLEVTHVMKDGSTGTWGLKIDTVAATDTISSSTTINSFGPVSIATTNGATTSPALARFALTAGAHTCVITTNNGGEVNILSAGVMPLTTSTDYVLAPAILHWGVLRQQAGANETATAAYDTQASTDCALLAGDGVRCNFVTGSHAAVPDACFFDSKHPADCGHEILYALARSLGYLPGGGGNTFYYLQFPYITSAQPFALATAKIFAAQSATDLYFGTDQIAGTEDVSTHAHNVKAENSFGLYDANEAHNLGVWVGQDFDTASNVKHCWSNSTTSVGTLDTCLSKLAAASVSVDDGTAGDSKGTITAAGHMVLNKIHTTGLTASVSTATLCAAVAGGCNVAGMYQVSVVIQQTGTACATPGPGVVTFTLTYTDTNGSTRSITAVNGGSLSMGFQNNLINANAIANVVFSIATNGAVIQYAAGYIGCTTGTGTYQLDIAVDRKF